MFNPVIKVNSINIHVPAHNGSLSGATVKSKPIIPQTNCRINGNAWIIHGDFGYWTCPICGNTYKFTVIGNSKIEIDGKKACVTNVSFDVEHNGSVTSMDVECDSKINIT